ncbi:MAG: EAL domain-containing protein [Ruminococcus sp.]|jgi:EAL domain-containing protein (putative c-di-GMP-specific phosphodiesterase class I)/GGDEF domain-containing protein
MLIEEKLQRQLRRASILVFCIIAVFFICGGLFSIYLRNTKNEAMEAQIIAEAEEYKTRILKQLDADFQTLITLSVFLKEDYTADRERLARYLDEANKENTFLTMAYFDQNGKGVISTIGQEPQVDADVSEISEEGQRGVEMAWEGEISVSRLFESEISNRRVFAYTVPVYDAGEVTGVLTASDHIEIFSDILSGNTVMGGGGYIHMLGSEGNFLIRSSNTVVKENLESIFDGPFLSETTSQEAREALQQKKRMVSTFRYKGKEYPFLLEPVGINGWYLFCVNTGEGLSASVITSTQAIQITFMAVLLMIFLLMIYGFYQLRKYNRYLVQLAYYDSLTGAENLSYFIKKLRKTMEKGRGSVAAIGIHRYPFIKETFGAEQADAILCKVKETIEFYLKKDEFICRDTEDRFYLFLTDTSEKVLTVRLERVIKEIEQNSVFSQTTGYQLRVCCGVDNLDTNADNMMLHASLALAHIDNSHIYSIQFFDTRMNQREKLENYIEGRMEQALKSGEFKLFLQPKQDLQSNTLAGAEALVRWITDDGKIIYPDQFIPLFEKNGFCVKLDIYMVEQACRQIRSWMDQGIKPIPISVNQTKLLFYKSDYVRTLVSLLRRYSIPADMIILEILEGTALENADELNKKITQLQAEGVRISLDDFGSGYSSLNTLSKLHIDELKLDRGFLLNISKRERERSILILKEVIQMAKQLHISVVAEGVETSGDEELIKNLQCDIGQGYFYSKPIDTMEFNIKYMKIPSV